MYIRQLTPADIPFGLALTTQNHWNQLEADWKRQLDLGPDGCFLAEIAGRPVGTACACDFDGVAWISLVLVEKEFRGRGIGTALMGRVLQHLDARGISAVRLDATPLGEPVYEKLGFQAEFTLARFEGVLPSPGSAANGAEAVTATDWPAVLELDELVTGTRREKLLRHLSVRKFVRAGRLEGFCCERPGANAWQIGPICGSAEAARNLFLDAARRHVGERVYLDVPVDHLQAVALVQAAGLTEQRRLLRMGRGRRVRERLEMFWSGFGPEKG